MGCVSGMERKGMGRWNKIIGLDVFSQVSRFRREM